MDIWRLGASALLLSGYLLAFAVLSNVCVDVCRIYTGEVTTKRIREAYLRSVLRQNIGFFDTLGAGEVTTRITSDMHLIQEGLSEKIPITAQFFGQSWFPKVEKGIRLKCVFVTATFIAGFVVAFIKYVLRTQSHSAQSY